VTDRQPLGIHIVSARHSGAARNFLPTLAGSPDGNQEYRRDRSGHCRRRSSLPHRTDLAGIPTYRYFLQRSRRRRELGTGRVVTHPDRGAREPENPRQMAGPPLASRPGRVNYLWIVEDRWGELCGSREVASHWADRLVGLLRTPWSDERPGSYVQGTSVCLSSLVAAGRQLLALRRFPFWHDCKFGVHVLLAQGRIDDALAFAEVLNQPNAALDVAARRYCSMPAE
jgi:hypothetical protein